MKTIIAILILGTSLQAVIAEMARSTTDTDNRADALNRKQSQFPPPQDIDPNQDHKFVTCSAAPERGMILVAGLMLLPPGVGMARNLRRNKKCDDQVLGHGLLSDQHPTRRSPARQTHMGGGCRRPQRGAFLLYSKTQERQTQRSQA
jgi:hypothetical protein